MEDSEHINVAVLKRFARDNLIVQLEAVSHTSFFIKFQYFGLNRWVGGQKIFRGATKNLGQRAATTENLQCKGP